MRHALAIALAGVAAAAPGACGAVQQRFPDDVQASLVHSELRRLETARFIIYYPAPRRAEVERFLVRAERCADALRASALIHNRQWRDKMVIAMPEVAFNNAFVSAELAGYEAVSVIPLTASLDFVTEYGLLPDPGYVACHELVHYVQAAQVGGFWHVVDTVFGHLYTPQLGYDPWFLEGLATHYEARLSGVGRPSWPIFTGMFAAAYAGHRIHSGDLSALGRLAPVGHHYLVGTMFVRFLSERYGDKPLWVAIADQARTLTGLSFTGSFATGFGVGFGDLLDQFDAWCRAMFPVRQRPVTQRALATLGNDARYARGRDGTEAWVANDVDAPAHLVVRDPGGAVIADLGLVDVLPPRTLVQADPVLVSGLSLTGDGREVWLTVIDLSTTYQVTRLLRWRRGDTALREISHTLGPGATIDPTGTTYYYCAVDGDRWSLAAWDAARDQRRTVLDMAPGTYVLGAQVSADGARLIANVWDGRAFVAWVIDAATGARLAELRAPGAPGAPIWDASFTDDGRAMYLGVVDGRFQVVVDGQPVTDAPYAALAARSARGTIRFLNRDGWNWTLDEIAAPAAPESAPLEPAPAASDTVAAAPGTPDAAAPGSGAAAPTAPGQASPGPAALQPVAPSILSDQPYSAWEHLWFPQLRAPTVVLVSSGVPHIGAAFGGGDRLGMQRWSIAGYVQPTSQITDRLHWGGDAGYLNTMLAPWQILANASFLDWVDPVAVAATPDHPAATLAEDHRTRDASLALARVWRGSLTTVVSAIYSDDFDRPPGDPPGVRRRLGGPALSLQWLASESTRYTGVRRALGAALSAAYYPHALSSFAGDIYDLRPLVSGRVALPFGRRHLFTARLHGRALVARGDTGLLQLGGDSGVATLYSATSASTEPPIFDTARFPPNLRFVEPLRGYEDFAITTDRAALGDAAWRYPVILDRGVAATLGFLPASFVSELDLELFAAGAVDRRRALHAAAGASLELHMTLLRIPFALIYQLARRVRDDGAITQLLGLGLTP